MLVIRVSLLWRPTVRHDSSSRIGISVTVGRGLRVRILRCGGQFTRVEPKLPGIQEPVLRLRDLMALD